MIRSKDNAKLKSVALAAALSLSAESADLTEAIGQSVSAARAKKPVVTGISGATATATAAGHLTNDHDQEGGQLLQQMFWHMGISTTSNAAFPIKALAHKSTCGHAGPNS